MEKLSLFTLLQSPPPIPQPVHDPYWDEITRDKVDEYLPSSDLDSDADSGQFLKKEFAPEQSNCVLEQTLKPSNPDLTVLEQAINDTKSAPEHNHWIEKYKVVRYGKEHYYYRYVWMQGRKLHHIHIPGGNTSSAIALKKKEVVEIAIADGETPSEIRKMIKGWGNSQQTSETSAAHPKS